MGRMLCFAVASAACGLSLPGADAGEKVVLRVEGGRWLRVAEDGSVRADRLVPGEAETFELLPQTDDTVALKAHDGRFLIAHGRDAAHLRGDSPRTEPGERETFRLVEAGKDDFALKAGSSGRFIRFVDVKADSDDDPDKPGPHQKVAIYQAGEVPAALRSALGLAIHAYVMAEVADRPYEKVRTRKKQKYIELPAPTLRDPGRKKRHRVLSMTEEYHVRAQLDGTPSIDIIQMPYLKRYRHGESGLLMFVAHARLPVRGQVRYRIPGTASATTKFRAVIDLDLVGEVRAERDDESLAMDPPKVRELRVNLSSLDLSNDLLNVARAPIEDLINHEVRRKRGRIVEQANKSLKKAVSAREFRHPLLRYLRFF